MTLYRQLVVVIVVLFVLMFGGTLWLNFDSTRTFLLKQLESHAQDTATSLGLSISTSLQQQDQATMESMVDAVFDRGYYEKIRVEDNDGKALVERQIPIVVDGVPKWFVASVRLDAPYASALIMSGWHQMGTVQVWSHPGYAYQELWRSSVDTGIWFVAAAVVLLLLGALALRFLLRPLKAVEHQAEQLARRHYEVQVQLPRTRELRSVVLAMNRLTEKVRSMFEEQSQVARRLRALSYEDELTGLANRRLFEDELAMRLAAGAEYARGWLLLVQIQGLKPYNDRQGYAAGDALVVKTSSIIKRHVAGNAHATAARLGGGDFALLIPGVGAEIGDKLAEAICSDFAEGVALEEVSVNVGVTSYQPGITRDQLLAAADAALRTAKATGSGQWNSTPMTETGVVAGRQEWVVRLRQVLEQQDVALYVQPVGGRDGGVLHQEVLVRIHDENGVAWSAGVFLPLAEELGLGRELDRVVVGKIVAQQVSASTPLAINLTAGSVCDQAFVEWMFETVSVAQLPPGRIQFEVAESIVVEHRDMLAPLFGRLRMAGYRCGIDHFGRSLADFSYLHLLQPDYVKISPSFCDGIVNEPDRQFLVRSLIAVAHSLDVEVIAEAVEEDVQRQILLDLGVDGVQGYLIGAPVSFEGR